jgi:nitrite reductase/ring-hydroxylating ferredoxin subunit
MQLDTSTADASELPYARHGIPKMGFRNYWYPILLSSELGRKPRPVRIMGEDLAMYRDSGKIYAVEDRCPHRGVKLSVGSCLYPGTGTITCPYHGWTFSGEDGQLKAKLMDGPDAKLVNRTRIKSYPAREHAGLIFIFMGDMEAVPLEDDLPFYIADQTSFFTISRHVDYKANWRLLVDNWPNDHHAPFAHRNSPELIFQPILPFAMTVITKPLADGRGISFDGKDGITYADFEGLGSFPHNNWWRFMKPSGRGKITNYENSKAYKVYGIQNQFELRLPGVVVVGRQSGDYCLVQWATPIDEHTTRCFNINNWRRSGRLRGLFDRLHYYVWRGWAHDWLFSGQDKELVEYHVPGPEQLSKTDTGVVAWRRYAGANARRPPEAPIREVI